MARWEGLSVITVVTQMVKGPPHKRPRYCKRLVVVEAATRKAAEQRIKDEVTTSRFPPRSGDEHTVEDLRKLKGSKPL